MKIGRRVDWRKKKSTSNFRTVTTMKRYNVKTEILLSRKKYEEKRRKIRDETQREWARRSYGTRFGEMFTFVRRSITRGTATRGVDVLPAIRGGAERRKIGGKRAKKGEGSSSLIIRYESRAGEQNIGGDLRKKRENRVEKETTAACVLRRWARGRVVWGEFRSEILFCVNEKWTRGRCYRCT